jgi:hypothetical protein
LSTETIDDIAERLERVGDRYHNAGDSKRENESRIAAGAVRGSADLTQAREIARAFDFGFVPGINEDHSALKLAERPPRRPWWRRWGSRTRGGPSDDSSDNS